MVMEKSDVFTVLDFITYNVGVNLVKEDGVQKYVNRPYIELNELVDTLAFGDPKYADYNEYKRQVYLYTVYHLYKEGYIVFTDDSCEFVYNHDYELCETNNVRIQGITFVGHQFMWDYKTKKV